MATAISRHLIINEQGLLIFVIDTESVAKCFCRDSERDVRLVPIGVPDRGAGGQSPPLDLGN